MEVKKNEFMKLREVVKSAVTQYQNLRERIDWKDAGLSATIQRVANPFLNGYFTVAVAGKMSAGKSTFINSLIGEKLLPTGHFQTTSGITWIVSSDKRHMEVTFADGHKQSYEEDFPEILSNLVAVPEQFDALPINDINRLITCGDGIKEILKKKAGIEKMTGTSSDEKLWREYVNQNPKSKIAEKVVIELVLPEQYEGWRIVDTPGIGAIGGIQDATKKLLTQRDENDRTHNDVDAVILLHNGKENIQDESANNFANDVATSMGELAKGRLFFVLTHAASPEFINYKDGILQRAKNLFGNRLGISDNNILNVDSVIQRFITDAQKSGRDFSKPESIYAPLEGWSSEEWSAIPPILYPLYYKLQQEKKEVSNSTIFATLKDIARYENLTDRLYDFLNNEKYESFNILMNAIEQECKTYGVQLEKDIKAVSSGKEEIEKQQEAAKEEKVQLDIALGKIQQKASPAEVKRYFKFIDQELLELSKKPSINEVRTAYLQIYNNSVAAEKDFFKTLINEFSTFAHDFNNEHLTFNTLDLDALEQEAEKEASTEVTDMDRPERVLVATHLFSSDDYKTTYPYTKTEVDFEKKRREFTAYVVKKGRENAKTFISLTESKSQNFLKVVDQNISDKTNNTINRLEGYKQQQNQKDELVATLNNKIKEIQKVIDFLNHLQ